MEVSEETAREAREALWNWHLRIFLMFVGRGPNTHELISACECQVAKAWREFEAHLTSKRNVE